MKSKGLYVILSLYSLTRSFTEYFEDNYELFDANILYFVFDGAIIALIGLFLYLHSAKDLAAKASLFLMISLGVAQAFSFIYSHFYNEYIHYLPILIVGVTLLELYKLRDYIERWLNGEI